MCTGGAVSMPNQAAMADHMSLQRKQSLLEMLKAWGVEQLIDRGQVK